MNEQEKTYFSAVSKDRAENARVMEKSSMRGIKNSVIEKYSDQAHFIYELLQNADDAGATYVRFVLERDRLIFAHNGSRLFSVSDPETEDSDAEKGTLGDINAICSIANSNKGEAKIGKFGVGFKAVFQYTSTPHIYDPNFRFKIERFVVPTLLDDDFSERRPNETLFVFPFDNPKCGADKAYGDISDKLSNLSFPLLFLSELRDIEFKIGDTVGQYGKNIERSYAFGDIRAEYVCLTKNSGSSRENKRLRLFSRSEENRGRYSVGFFVGDDGHLRPVNEPAFCFFPTKETTGLNFIIHAPFLLTDSRENIRAGEPHNRDMIRCLADLAARSIVCLKEIGELEQVRLIEDNITDIIPYDKYKFSPLDDKSKISFLPFHEAIKEAFQKEQIIPSTNGCVSSADAYWAAVPQLAQLFSNEQLGKICGNENACWVFSSKGRDETQRNNKALCSFIESFVKTVIDEDAIINGRTKSVNVKIDEAFIESQPVLWLHRFYKWLSESSHRSKAIRKKPVFLNQDKKAVAVFDDHDQPILFLPAEDVTGYTVVYLPLLEDSDTRKFIEGLGVKEPSLKDKIYNIVLPQYKKGEQIEINETYKHFELIFKFYCKSFMDDEDENFIGMIKDYEFLAYYSEEDPRPFRGAASTMYFPDSRLKEYFESKPDTRFIAIDKYKELVSASKEKQLRSFLKELGVKDEIAIVTVSVDGYLSNRKDLPHPRTNYPITWKENVIEGCREIVEHIAAKKDKDKSVLLWNCLLSIIETTAPLSECLSGTCRYYYYKDREESFTSSDEILLKNEAWLFNREGEFVNAGELTRASIPKDYDVSKNEARDLLKFLNIAEAEEVSEGESGYSNLTDSQREDIEFAKEIKAMGFDKSDLPALKEILPEIEKCLEQKRSRKPEAVPSEKDGDTGQNDGYQAGRDDHGGICFDYSANESAADSLEQREFDKTACEVVRDIAGRIGKTPLASPTDRTEEAEDVDRDEYMPPTVDYSRRIERAKQKNAAEIGRIVHSEELRKRALTMPKYSFGWFKTLLEMESLSRGETNSDSREVSISFAKVEHEPQTRRTLVLKHPNRYIPQFMEDLADIPLVLHIGNTTKTVAIEVANIKSYSLRVKLKSGADIEGIDLTEVSAAVIDAKSPAFLLEELRKQFAALNYDDDFNMQENLCENIEFVFGPPGTGKTYHLANKVLLPLMRSNNNCKVLVLTPTNKAADVLVGKIMEISGSDLSYEDWLVRFGATGDEKIEQSPVFRDKTFDIRSLSKNVTVTTIARFPYDFFMPQGERIFLCGINWDYIVVDEASMIPLANIIYPLYKKTPEKFIIAGDPFQIEPITSVNLWKSENIYTMVNLNSFVNPKTTPHRYKVELLTTQFRSIPEIGDIFSKFAYGGILKHHRLSKERRPLNLGNGINIQPLNIIKFPVSRHESIYRAKTLQYSPYQIYSALFVYECVCRLARAIAAANPEKPFKIGVIAPYRAQADLIDKLLASETLPKKAQVQSGTIHRFQGDECDIVFSVFNTPPKISCSEEMFLNKLNIINVSISRARDYLFIIMPDDNTENISDLHLVKRVEALTKSTNAWTEAPTSELEALMFGDPNYLENNAFSTGHQSVNVYGLPEKCYEIRAEDNAVDIQIHRE